MVETATKPNKHIPDDVVFNILSRLPAKSLSRFRCVSKGWRSLIQDPAFIDCYFEQSKKRQDDHFYKVSMICVDSRYPNYYHSMIYSINKDMFTVEKNFYCVSHRFVSTSSCNGLICFIGNLDETGKYYVQVRNPVSDETLILPYFDFGWNEQTTPMTGIGFDSITRNYKVVCWDTQNDFQVQIITLGAHSWRMIRGPCIGE